VAAPTVDTFTAVELPVHPRPALRDLALVTVLQALLVALEEGLAHVLVVFIVCSRQEDVERTDRGASTDGLTY
jgi:hypothetical protein